MLAKQLSSASAGVDVSWDLAYANYEAQNAWDISTSKLIRATSTAIPTTQLHSVFFKPDGSQIYLTDNTGDTIYQRTLTRNWDISSITSAGGSSLVVTSQDSIPRGIFFKPDGTKMYLVGGSGNDVNEYSLSTAWSISTASYVQNFSVSSEETIPHAIFFKPDGTKMYVSGQSGDDVNEYSLSTAWDISTASYSQAFSVATKDNAPTGLSFSPDGLKMYVLGNQNKDLYEYSLSTAWDISTSTFLQSYSISASTDTMGGIFFKDDGTAFYVGSIGTADVLSQYSIGGFSVDAQEGNPSGLFFKPDGAKMYVIGTSGDDVNEYSLSTAWDISTASYVQNFSVSSRDATPRDIFFKDDGTKMYFCGATNDRVYEYTLSTAWDISTASYVRQFTVTTQVPNPSGLFFKPDGTKMYLSCIGNDHVSEYSLSTAWDISTASHTANFSTSAQDLNQNSLYFKDDGTKMFLCGSENDKVYEYTLSTAWDISTASYAQDFYVTNQATVPTGLFFNQNGKQFFVIDDGVDVVFNYTISQ